MLDVLVWAGTLTFAVGGALTALQKRFDLVGVLVLAAVTAIGGGSIRDVVTGTVPPPSLTNEGLLWAIASVGVATFLLHRFVPRLLREGRLLYTVDTISLGLFAALGAERGLAVGFGFWGSVFAGAVSGVGGGVIRDVLSGEVPGILYRSGDFYASAAAGGAAVVYLGETAGLEVAVLVGALVTVMIRVGSRLAGLNLPLPRTD